MSIVPRADSPVDVYVPIPGWIAASHMDVTDGCLLNARMEVPDEPEAPKDRRRRGSRLT